MRDFKNKVVVITGGEQDYGSILLNSSLFTKLESAPIC